MWQAQLAGSLGVRMLTGQVDQYGGDTCHHWKGDMCHARTTCVAGTDTWQVADVVIVHLLVDDMECFRPMVWCHMAQTWASMWHPLVGLKFLVQNFVGVSRIELETSHPAESSQRLGTSLPTPWRLQLYDSTII
jgi:hypothetical protein